MLHQRRSLLVLMLLLLVTLGLWLAANSQRGGLTGRHSGSFTGPAVRSGSGAPPTEEPLPSRETVAGDTPSPDPTRSRQANGSGVAAPSPAPPAKIWVYVAGSVRHPGVYTLSPDARVFQAIDAAGGILPEGHPEALNLAAPLQDGQKIWVPDHAPQNPMAGMTPGTGAAAGRHLDINTASAEQLQQLPGIGPKLAAAIVTERQRNGRFSTVDDLERVSGIGPKLVERLRDWLAVP